MKVKTLIVLFDNKLPLNRMPLFRGAIIDLVGGDDMYHNHKEDSFYYRYPFIQYKRIHGQAAIFTIGPGTEQITKLLNANNFKLKMGEESETFVIEKIIPGLTFIQTWDSRFHYHLRKWVALNSENYTKYLAMETVIERTQFLQNILTGNILSMCKGLGITIEKTIECLITHIDEPHKVKYKGNSLMSFDLEFASNVSLPDYIGLGKAVSMGYGMVVMKHEKKKLNNNPITKKHEWTITVCRRRFVRNTEIHIQHFVQKSHGQPERAFSMVERLYGRCLQ